MDGLLRYTAEGRLRPALAEGFSISDDGLTYTFALRQGVRYHNGEPFSGEDFVAAWELSQEREFGALSTLGWQKVESVDLPDETTLLVSHHRALRPLPLNRRDDLPAREPRWPKGRLLPRDLRQCPGRHGAVPRHRLGPGSGVALGRWDDYWGEPARLERIDYRVLPDVDALLAALEAAEIDLVGGSRRSRPLASTRRRLFGTDHFRHGTMNWQHIDLKQMGFLLETVRQALDFAMPRERIIAEILSGRAIPPLPTNLRSRGPITRRCDLVPSIRSGRRVCSTRAGLLPGADGVRQRDGKRSRSISGQCRRMTRHGPSSR